MPVTVTVPEVAGAVPVTWCVPSEIVTVTVSAGLISAMPLTVTETTPLVLLLMYAAPTPWPLASETLPGAAGAWLLTVNVSLEV